MISGGTEISDDETLTTCIVSDGEGIFNTYEYGNEGEITKPKYKFEVIGYQKMN